MLYFKLSLKNIIKSINEYTIYVVTLILCAALYYGFNSIQSDSRIASMIPGINSMYSQVTKAVTFVMLSIIFLVSYINKFVIKKRSKEFALYSLMGMKQMTIAILFFIENLFIGILSVLAGSLLGTGIGYFLRGIIIESFEITLKNSLIFDVNIILKTAVFLISILVLVGMLNIVKISKGTLIELLKDSKKNEKIVKSKKLYTVMFILSVVTWIISFYKIYLYFKNYGMISDESSHLKEIIIIPIMIISVFGIYGSLGGFVATIKSRFKRLVANECNLFIINEMVSKIVSKSTVIATVSIVVLISLISFSLGSIMEIWAVNHVRSSFVYDYEIYGNYNDVRNSESSLEIKFDDFYPRIDELVEVEDGATFNLYFNNENDFYTRRKTKFPPLLMKVSDYNTIRGINNLNKIELKENEFFIHYSERSIDDEAIKNLQIVNDGLLVNDGQLKLKLKNTDSNLIGNAILNDYVRYTIIVDDNYVKNKKIARSGMLINFKEKVDLVKINEIDESFKIWIKEYNTNDLLKIVINKRGAALQNSKITAMIVKLTGMLIGTLFIVMSLTVLAVHQMIESVQNKNKYVILNKLGVDKKKINSIIRKQIVIYFIMPIIMSFSGFAIFMLGFKNGFSKDLTFLLQGNNLFSQGIVFPISIFLSIYILYYLLTVSISKRNINRYIQ